MESSQNIITLSKSESKKFKSFHDLLKKPDNFYSLFPNLSKDKPKNEKKNLDSLEFYEKYEHLSNCSGPEPFELEKELAKYIKFWHSKDIDYIVEPGLTQDDFFNEENVKSNILKDKYIKMLLVN